MRILKWLAALVAAGIVLYCIWIGIALWRLPAVTPLADPGANLTVQVKDWQGRLHPYVVGPRNAWWTPYEHIPEEMAWAVIVAEDANFYRHEGIDVKAIKNALMYDLQKKRFARGASTITQQAAKNLFLSREKTITRKIEEIWLARRMERELTKGRILELYLNVVELGPMVYGVGHGARYYFDKPAASLTPASAPSSPPCSPVPRRFTTRTATWTGC